MAKVEIIGMPQSTFVRVVRMTCEEKGVPYELTAARPHSPEINAVHPFGKVPGMRHGDVELCESKAIATYLDRTFGGTKVIPEDPAQAAHVEQWVSIVNTTIDPTMIRQYLLSYIFPKGPDGKPDRKVIDAALAILGTRPSDKARVMHIRNTLWLEEVEISEPCMQQLTKMTEFTVEKGPYDMTFDGAGNLEAI